MSFCKIECYQCFQDTVAEYKCSHSKVEELEHIRITLEQSKTETHQGKYQILYLCVWHLDYFVVVTWVIMDFGSSIIDWPVTYSPRNSFLSCVCLLPVTCFCITSAFWTSPIS